MVNGKPEVELLATFPRTPREEVRVSIVREEGKEDKVDLRLWWRVLGEEGEEEWRPTRRGVRFLVSALPKLIQALRRAASEAPVAASTAAQDAISPPGLTQGEGGEAVRP